LFGHRAAQQLEFGESGYRGIGDLGNGIVIGCRPGIGNGIVRKYAEIRRKSGAKLIFRKIKKPMFSAR